MCPSTNSPTLIAFYMVITVMKGKSQCSFNTFGWWFFRWIWFFPPLQTDLRHLGSEKSAHFDIEKYRFEATNEKNASLRPRIAKVQAIELSWFNWIKFKSIFIDRLRSLPFNTRLCGLQRTQLPHSVRTFSPKFKKWLKRPANSVQILFACRKLGVSRLAFWFDFLNWFDFFENC